MHTYLRARTVKAAKREVKLRHQQGGTIRGYCNELGVSVLVYICYVVEYKSCRRICFSDRCGEEPQRYRKPDFFQFWES